MQARRLLLILRRAPYAGVHFAEALDALLVAAAFEQRCAVLLMDDAVYALLHTQRGDLLGLRNAARMLTALPDYEVEHVYACAESLAARNLAPLDASIDVTALGTAEQAALIRAHDVIWND